MSKEVDWDHVKQLRSKLEKARAVAQDRQRLAESARSTARAAWNLADEIERDLIAAIFPEKGTKDKDCSPECEVGQS